MSVSRRDIELITDSRMLCVRFCDGEGEDQDISVKKTQHEIELTSVESKVLTIIIGSADFFVW